MEHYKIYLNNKLYHMKNFNLKYIVHSFSKMAISLLITLGFSLFQSPAFADTPVSTWTGLDTAVTSGASDITFITDITAGVGDAVIINPLSTTVIDAKSYFISGNSTTQIFENDDTLTIKNMTLKNGTATNGGAILNYWNLSVSNSTFTNNKATSAGGGAIYSQYGTLTISNSNFTSNDAARNGGAIRFISNTATITDSTFSNNHADNVGGAISSAGTLTITKGTFTGNQSYSLNKLGVTGGGGGALCVESPSGNTIITNTSFTNNTAHEASGGGATGGYGGAIYFGGATSRSMNIIADNGNTTFTGNNDKSGSNDIYLAKGFSTGGDIATLNLNAGNGGQITFNGGIASDSTNNIININKSGVTGSVSDSAPIDGTVDFNAGISTATVNLYNGTMKLENETYLNSTDNFGVYGGILNTQNSATGTINLNSLTLGGTGNWLMDVDLINQLSDKIVSSASGTGALNISNINLLNDANTNLTTITVAEGTAKNYITNSVSSISTALYNYGVTYDGSGTNGVLNFTRTGFSPNAITSDVAQTQTFLLQTAMNRQFFGNVDAFMSFPLAARESTICCALSNGDKYTGAACPISGNGTFSPIYLCDLNKGIWLKNFVSFENVPLRNGPNVSTVEYGTLIGMDAPLTYLKRGWVGNTSAFVGYLGSNQNYDQVGVSQNGALVGLAENMVKGNNFLTLMASVGSSMGISNTRWGNDYFNSIFAGAAAKGGHNFEFKDGEYIVQPNLMLSYIYTYTPTYNTAAGLEMTSKPLNAIQVAPGVRLIKNMRHEKGQVYLVSNFVYNIMDNTKFSANDVQLPELSIAPYIEYGIGYQRVWKERFTGFFQTLLRGGGRNGIALQFGLRWAI